MIISLPISITHSVKKKRPRILAGASMYQLLVVLQPLLDLGLSQAQDVLGGVDGFSTAADVQEVQALGSLVQILLVAVGIAQVAEGVGLGSLKRL